MYKADELFNRETIEEGILYAWVVRIKILVLLTELD